MANINLLPWRQELRQEKQRQFLVVLAGVAGLALFVVFSVKGFYDNQLSQQNARNQYLKQEISKLDRRIAEINALSDTRKELIERMELIQNLQGNRPVIVRIFDELARAVPDDLYYTSLEVTGQRVLVKGEAKSNNRVAALMRTFDESEWFTEPALQGVKSLGNGRNEFEVTMKRVEPRESEEQ